MKPNKRANKTRKKGKRKPRSTQDEALSPPPPPPPNKCAASYIINPGERKRKKEHSPPPFPGRRWNLLDAGILNAFQEKVPDALVRESVKVVARSPRPN